MSSSGPSQSGAPPPPGPPGGGPSQQLVPAKPIFQIVIGGKAFPDAQSALAYIKTMQNGTQRYHALTELTGHMMRASGVMDDWFETIWSEVETLKQGTDDWKSNEFRTKWKEVSSKAKAVREKRNQVREAIEWLVEKHNWCTREFNDEVLTSFLFNSLTS